MTKTILYFTAGATPTVDEQADIDSIENTTAAYALKIRNTLGANYTDGVPEAADYVAGTPPAAYANTTTYPRFDPDAQPELGNADVPDNQYIISDAEVVQVDNSAGTVHKNATADINGGALTSLKLPATVAMVTSGDTKTGVTGSGTTATITVTAGVISGIALS